MLDQLTTPFGRAVLSSLATSPGPVVPGAALPPTSVPCPGWSPGCAGTPWAGRSLAAPHWPPISALPR